MLLRKQIDDSGEHRGHGLRGRHDARTGRRVGGNLKQGRSHGQQRIALTDAFVIGLAATRSVLGNVPAAELPRRSLRSVHVAPSRSAPVAQRCSVRAVTCTRTRRRAAMTSPLAAETLRRVFAEQVAPKLITATPDHPVQRIGLMGAFVIGLAITRYVLVNPPVAGLSREELSRWAAPVIKQLLVGPAPT